MSSSYWPLGGGGVTFDSEFKILDPKWQKFFNITMLLQPVRALRHQKTRSLGKERVSNPKTRMMFSAEAYFFAPLSASPKMSPSDAPESDEPYCSTACFSSASCSALTEKFGFFERSKPVIIASNF